MSQFEIVVSAISVILFGVVAFGYVRYYRRFKKFIKLLNEALADDQLTPEEIVALVQAIMSDVEG